MSASSNMNATGTAARVSDLGRATQPASYTRLVLRQFVKNRAAVFAAGLLITVFLIVGIAPLFLNFDPFYISLRDRLEPPSLSHPLGTDLLGRDIATRLVFGGRISLLITSTAVALALIIGTVLGTASGFYGKSVDMILMRVVDVLMTLPGFLLAVAIIAALGPGTYNVILAVGIFSIPTFARIARGSTLSVESQDYVLAARSIGANSRRIMSRHILPNIVPPLLVQTSLRLATAMITAASLSFLGLGPQPPTPEWGAMLADGRDFIINAPQLIFYPGVTIFLVAMSFNMVGDGLRDALDPYLRR